MKKLYILFTVLFSMVFSSDSSAEWSFDQVNEFFTSCIEQHTPEFSIATYFHYCACTANKFDKYFTKDEFSMLVEQNVISTCKLCKKIINECTLEASS